MTGDDRPRAAIIGAGLMGRWHADAVRRLGGSVSVVVDPNEAAREALGRRHPGARLLPELDPELIARCSTAAHVCTPLATHAAVVAALVDMGVNVLVEKPVAENAETTQRLLTAAEKRGVVICPVHQFEFQTGVQWLLASLPTLAGVRRVEFSTCSAGASGEDAASLDRLVAEILPHPLGLSSAVLGTSVALADWQLTAPVPGELTALATIGGAVVVVSISAHGRPTENVFRVVGNASSITAYLFHGFAVRHAGEVSRARKIARPFVDGGAVIGSALFNLVRRAIDREPAYPGLRELVRRFYLAARGEAAAPIAPAVIADIAVARDELLALVASCRGR
jgi:predicted dehydrogenase